MFHYISTTSEDKEGKKQNPKRFTIEISLESEKLTLFATTAFAKKVHALTGDQPKQHGLDNGNEATTRKVSLAPSSARVQTCGLIVMDLVSNHFGKGVLWVFLSAPSSSKRHFWALKTKTPTKKKVATSHPSSFQVYMKTTLAQVYM